MKTPVFTLIALLFVQLSLAQGSKNFIDQNYIEVTGKAEMEIMPDEIYLKILINEADNKGKESVESLENKMIENLKTLGINIDEQLVIKDFSSNFKNYFLKKTDIQTAKEYQLLVHNGKTLGEVFLALEDIGISNIEIERVDHSEIEKYRRMVKIDAIKAGKDKAGDLAEAIGQSIGKAIYIREIENFNERRALQSNVMIRGLSATSVKSKVPELEFEKINLEYSLQIYFELK